ncbi:receptor-type tyrosine-protein phosphatase O isoform X3 [Dendropsophus ebraccatus]|uniref:receptor-type tyrosine-protein phosphatase O isoform X3 n=1 Tax=Dendropsophus ebraccatus TaxID=150705 RepID=UPI00383100A5
METRAGASMLPVLLCLLLLLQESSMFQVRVTDDNLMLISLEKSDVTPSSSMYVVKITGESKNYFFQFEEFNSSLPNPLVFNASYHGLYYIITLMVINANLASRPSRSMTVLTKPLPVSRVLIHDYKPSPETGVVFEVYYPEKFNVFTRVNISYWEGSNFRTMLYKDFFRGKTVFNHWLPGICYRDVTFQLVSEASFNKSTLVQSSGIGHTPQQHRTAPYPPRNISILIVVVKPSRMEMPPGGVSPSGIAEEPPGGVSPSGIAEDSPGGVSPSGIAENSPGGVSPSGIAEEPPGGVSPSGIAEEPPGGLSPSGIAEEPPGGVSPFGIAENSPGGVSPGSDPVSEAVEMLEDQYESSAVISSYNWSDYKASDHVTPSQPYWWVNVTTDSEGFVNEIPPDYDNQTLLTSESFHDQPVSPTFRLLLNWFPPKPPTAYDGFNIYIQKDDNTTEVSTVDENTHEFVTDLKEPGKYKLTIRSFSSSGSCPIRESHASRAMSFYISPEGQWFEELTARPVNVTVNTINSTAALVLWTSFPTSSNEFLVSVKSQTCKKQKESQRVEKRYCEEVNITSNLISDLVPGAQYRVVVYLQKAPLLGPPSDPVLYSLEPPGVRDLVLYPLGPSSVVLSWTRPYLSSFRKYVVEMFYFNPITMISEWTPYYEIAATVSLTSTVRLSNLLPAWYYNFRVTMVTWGDPELSCCDTSTLSFITAPVAPHIVHMEYVRPLLYVTWRYGEDALDLSHSRMLHWQVTAEGRKRIKKSVSRTTMTAVLSLPAGDIYNITVTACTERSSNNSLPQTVRLDPAPPKSLYAVNKTQTSFTLLWVEDGFSDHHEVICWRVDPEQSQYEKDPVTVFSHVVTIGNLHPGTSYNCSICSVSHHTPSVPTYILVSTLVAELNPNVVVISLLAILSILLIGLLLATLIVLRRKHLQMSRECGAGTFINFATLERDGKLPYNWRRSIFAFLTLLPSCLWTDYLLAFYINPWSKNGFKKRKLTNPVQLDDFDSYIMEMAKDSDYKFSLQFEELKMIGLDIPHCAADLPANRCKNRYTNILPYDFSRVKLVTTEEEDAADYINANYIPGYNSLQEYIATQGPLPDTRNDFWRMILQQKSQVIVMLTQCNEKRRIKCDHYWPFTAEPVTYGDVAVEMVSEEEQPDWACRVFRVSHEDDIQHVMHFNFTAWPDHGVPAASAAESVLQFVYMVRQKAAKTKGPITVHCSAGVGRTGTFIALDRLMQHIRDHEFVDVLGLVGELRSYRMSMVQTEEQFIFLHHCVQLMWKKKQQQFRISDVIYENVHKS